MLPEASVRAECWCMCGGHSRANPPSWATQWRWPIWQADHGPWPSSWPVWNRWDWNLIYGYWHFKVIYLTLQGEREKYEIEQDNISYWAAVRESVSRKKWKWNCIWHLRNALCGYQWNVTAVADTSVDSQTLVFDSSLTRTVLFIWCASTAALVGYKSQRALLGQQKEKEKVSGYPLSSCFTPTSMIHNTVGYFCPVKRNHPA